jgi:hypothetical protein
MSVKFGAKGNKLEHQLKLTAEAAAAAAAAAVAAAASSSSSAAAVAAVAAATTTTTTAATAAAREQDTGANTRATACDTASNHKIYPCILLNILCVEVFFFCENLSSNFVVNISQNNTHFSMLSTATHFCSYLSCD